VQYAADNWQIEERTTDEYIERANAYFAETSVINRDEQIGLALRRYHDLYQKNMRIDDYKAALATQKEIVNLLGLGAPKRTEVTGAAGGDLTIILKTGQSTDDI
jgi:leucyl aminopeptidase (aminopeptidase T)